MPTDEPRMRERFEKWAETESFDLTASIHTGAYIHSDTRVAWFTWLARDAEVRKLRGALGSIVHASNNWAMPVKAFDVVGKLADIARAALAGGETGGAANAD